MRARCWQRPRHNSSATIRWGCYPSPMRCKSASRASPGTARRSPPRWSDATHAEAAAHAADAFAREGRKDSARRAAARTRDLNDREQGSLLPAITELDAGAVALTERETQLVHMASDGLSNAEIAARLVLSVRTVESHLYRAMQKLGVRDRHEL